MEFAGLSVSRETIERLELFQKLLEKWTTKINLVSRSTLADARERHLIDSAQLFHHMPRNALRWVDLGSGGGFPGLVIAILAKQLAPDLHVTLVESDTRKATFLRSIIRETEAEASVMNARIEGLEPLDADVISARAVANLDKLLTWTHRHLSPDGTALFLKGETWKKEISDAQGQWSFSCKSHKSITEDNAVVLEIGDLSYV